MDNTSAVKRRERLIVIPTYNEIDNIEKLVVEIDKANAGGFDMLFVDDNSPDGTGKLIDRIRSKRADIFVIHRKGKMGLGSAYLDGFQYGVKNGYKHIFEMDADLSHDPGYLKEMEEKLKSYDVVVASRFMGELGNINVTPFRILTSIIAVMYMRVILALGCSDPMGGFVGYRSEVLKNLDYPNFLAKGYAFQAEMKYECKKRGFTITEIPIIFKKRRACDSKMSKNDIMEALFIPWKIRFFKK